MAISDEALQHGDQRADDLALGLGFGVTGEAGGRAAGRAVRRRSGARYRRAGPGSWRGASRRDGWRCRGGIAADESERDRAVDGSEDGRRPGPEAFEQAAKLIGESDALSDQVVAAADQGAQRLDLVGGGHQGAEAVAVGAQDVGQHVSVARIGFAAGGAVRGRQALTTLGWIGMTGCPASSRASTIRPDGRSMAMGSSAGGAIRGAWQPCQPGPPHRGAPRCGRRPDRPVDDTDGVGFTAPVQTSVKWHVLISLGCGRLTRAGRSCGSLTDRRSGWQALALHPVVRRGLPAPAVRRVSCGPSSGERRWPSRQMLGLADTNAATRFRIFHSEGAPVSTPRRDGGFCPGSRVPSAPNLYAIPDNYPLPTSKSLLCGE